MTHRIRASVICRLVAAFGLMALALTVTAPVADAAIQGLCTYYNNAQHSQVVGQRGYDCCGNPVNWGTTSSYYYCHQEYCVWCPPEEM